MAIAVVSFRIFAVFGYLRLFLQNWRYLSKELEDGDETFRAPSLNNPLPSPFAAEFLKSVCSNLFGQPHKGVLCQSEEYQTKKLKNKKARYNLFSFPKTVFFQRNPLARMHYTTITFTYIRPNLNSTQKTQSSPIF